MNDENSKLFDEYAHRYEDSVNSAIQFSGLELDFFTKVKAQYIARLAKKHLGPPQNLRVLDLGCGVGNFEALLSSQFGSMAGVDVSAQSITQARDLGLDANFEVYDGQILPFDDGAFDLVFTVCVMHHILPQNRMQVLQEVRRVTRPGGMFQIFEHNPRNPLTMRVVNSCPFDEDAVLLTSKQAVDYLSRASFRDSRTAGILTVPPLFNWMYGVDRAFSKFGLGAQYYAYGFV